MRDAKLISFHDTVAGQERKRYRRLIRKSDLTHSQKEVLQVLVNLWFYHRGGARMIHPGKPLLAKRAKCSERTVASALALFRGLGFLKAIKYETGGQGVATQYRVDLTAIQEAFEPSSVVHAEGELARVGGALPCNPEGGKCTQPGCKNCTLSIGEERTPKDPCQIIEFRTRTVRHV